MQPKRIQRKRSKGWRMPEGVVYVGRPTKWGNPFKVGTTPWSRLNAVDEYRRHLYRSPRLRQAARRELAGKDLACWCAPDRACHADVLLHVANS